MGFDSMKLGQYIVIGGLAYFAFFMLRKPKQDSSVNYDSNGDGIYSGLNEIDRGDGIIEYRSDDGKLSTVNTGFNRKQDGTREFYVGGELRSSTGIPSVTPAPESPTSLGVGFGMNSYTSINGNGRSVSF